MPETRLVGSWLRDYFLLKEGYTKEDIEMMSTEEYDFMLDFINEKNQKNKIGGI